MTEKRRKVLVMCAEHHTRREICSRINGSGVETGEVRNLVEAFRMLRDFPEYGLLVLGDEEKVSLHLASIFEWVNNALPMVVRGPKALESDSKRKPFPVWGYEEDSLGLAKRACELMQRP
jgi:hypothetical protein